MKSLPPLARALLALGLVLLLGAIFNPGLVFFRPGTHLDLLGSVSVLGVLSLGMTLVILGGGIDLSVGSVLALSGMVFSGLTLAADWHWLPAALLALVAGCLCGAVNGAMVARFAVQPFVATLAMMVIARGLAKWLPALAGQPAGSKFMPAGPAVAGPPFYEALAGRTALGLPVMGLLWLLLAGAVALVLQRTTFGRHLYALGGNETASRLSGVPVARVKVTAYAACGALAGLAGICQVSRDVHGNPGAGMMFELQAIAAVVIGGTSLTGGRGGALLTVVGVLTIGYIDKVLSLNGIEEHWRLVLQGAIILAAVLFQDRKP